MGTGQEPRRPKVMRVATRCRTVEELIAAFSTLVDEHSLVVLTDQQRVIGSRQPFVVELADGQMVMKGEAEVVESTAPPKGRLRLRFLSLDATGREIHGRMIERKRAVAAGKTPGNGKPRAPTEPGLKPLVRIPEPAKKEASGPARPAAPPAPFARPAPLPRQATPAVPMPVIPPKHSALGTTPPRKAQLAPPPGTPSVPAIPAVPHAMPSTGTLRMPSTVKPPMAPPPVVPPPVPPPDPAPETIAVPVPPAGEPRPILKANDLPDFDDLPELDGDTSVQQSPLPIVRPATSPPEDGERTPGSPYVLPANPFGDVAPESLEAFVECTVYEETGQFHLEEDAPSELDDPLAEPPPPPITPPPPVPAPVMGPDAPPAPPDRPVPHATPLPQPYPAHLAAPVDLELDQQRRRKRLGMILGGIAAFGVVVGVIASQCGGGSDSARAGAPQAASKPTAVDAAAAAVPDPDPVAVPSPDPVPAPEPSPGPDPGPDPVAEPAPVGDCELSVTTTPAGASVSHAGRSLGDAPLRAAVPCGPGKVSISYRRYATVEKSIAPRPGEAAEVKVRLERPEQKISIRSRPPGATITVDGESVGKAPVSTTVEGFTSIKVTATLDGYQPWSQKVYVKKESSTITATLKKAPKRR